MAGKTTTNKKTDEPKVTSPVISHDSNPFTTTLRGIKKLFNYNTNSLLGAIVFSLFLGALLIATLAAIALGLVAFILQHALPDSGLFSASLPPEFITFAGSMSMGSVYATWLIGVILAILIGAFLQAIQIKLVAASANSQAIGFGDLLRQSAQRVLPLLGLMAIMALAVIASVGLLSLIGRITGPIIVVFVIIAVVAALYLCVRLAFSAFSVIEEGLGSIASLKRSLELTKGHFIETIGILAATTLFALVPSLILDLLGNAVSGPASSIMMLLSTLVSMVASAIASVGLAERFLQLRAIKSGAATATKTHALNYVAVALLLVGYMIAGTLNKPHGPGYNQNPYHNSEFNELEKLPNKSDKPIPDNAPPSYNLN